MLEHSYCNTVLFERKSVFVTSTSGFSLMHATSIKPVGVGPVLSSALICAGLCVRVKKEKTTQIEVNRVVVITRRRRRRRRRRRARIRKKRNTTYNQQNERTGVASDGDDIFLGPIARTRDHSRVILFRVRAFGCCNRIRPRLSCFLAFLFSRRSRRRSGRHVVVCVLAFFL